jgi:probable H4MPT-linked C1 transfer pathway protein
MSVVALDIGGANLKAAHSDGQAYLQSFDLWKEPERLTARLRELLGHFSRCDLLAVTMTGELCDCFPTKRDGVNAILDAVEAAAPNVPIRVWQTDGCFVEPNVARRQILRTASANWLALAELAGRIVPESAGLLVDVGSTTSDIIPIWNGQPVPAGLTDTGRLQYRELVYTGVRRTPVCALMRTNGAAELFATTLDVYLILGDLAEDETDRATADGRPATRSAALARLARMTCGDMESCTESDLIELARRIARRQQSVLRRALRTVTSRLPQPVRGIVIAGSGEFLARTVTQMEYRKLPVISVAKWLGPTISESACAYAVMVLTRERCDECR